MTALNANFVIFHLVCDTNLTSALRELSAAVIKVLNVIKVRDFKIGGA